MQQIFALVLLLPLFAHSARLNNEYCRPRATLVAIDNPNFNFFPYFVKLQRCGGSCDTFHPSVKSCIPLQYKEVPVSVQVVGTKKMTTIMERNHTHCGCECVIGLGDCNLELEEWKPDLCQCKCKYDNKPCGNGFTWSKRDCRCVCDKKPETCPSNKVWSSTDCKCVCKDSRYRKCQAKQKFVDQETCRCINSEAPETNEVSASQHKQKGGVRQELYIVLFLGQFVFLYLVFDAILYRKKSGLIYRLTRSCSSHKGDSSGNIDSSREDIFSESNSTVVTDIGQRNVATSDV